MKLSPDNFNDREQTDDEKEHGPIVSVKTSGLGFIPLLEVEHKDGFRRSMSISRMVWKTLRVAGLSE